MWVNSVLAPDGEPSIRVAGCLRDRGQAKVTGDAAVYEGTLLWRLLAGGAERDQGFVNAGSPFERRVFELLVPVPDNGEYVLELSEEEMESEPNAVRSAIRLRVPAPG